MIGQSNFRFQVDATKEIDLALPPGVFVPTGTTKVLFKAVSEYIKEPGKMLDLGCGCGVMGIALQQKGLVKGSLYASDLSREAVDCLQKNAKQYQCPVVAKCGSLFAPWAGAKFDYIVDDVSGVSTAVAKLSPWFKDVPCDSGIDGISLINTVIREAPRYLNPGGRFFFPIVSFSNANKIVEAAKKRFSHVELLAHAEWPLPKEMHQHVAELKRLQKDGHVQLTEKFGMMLWFTDVYVTYNS